MDNKLFKIIITILILGIFIISLFWLINKSKDTVSSSGNVVNTQIVDNVQNELENTSFINEEIVNTEKVTTKDDSLNQDTFSFGIQGDSHPERAGKMFSSDLYKTTLQKN